ncbi:hypothetical protein LMTR13_25465 [Bradyrhizobium icense]|uniref:Uncharacterized protein n=1 Tax=Bradyrhizobium icense TaxID=1274631 RepID=A0A1B1UJZ3_9BRAD|nr:hypothetical protein LMTR13_25465 [Bradyrhizobium icense]
MLKKPCRDHELMCKVEACATAGYLTRRVTAIQHGNAIFSMLASFHAYEQGAFVHQERMPKVPPPEKLTAGELPNRRCCQHAERFRRWYEPDCPIELNDRAVELHPVDDARIHP